MRRFYSSITNMSKINRIKKAIKAFITAYKNDMSFEENSVYARTETLTAVTANDAIIKHIEGYATQVGSLQWQMLDGFLRKCLEKKFPPGILQMYQDDKKQIPGLNIDIKNFGDVGNGVLRQEIQITIHKQLLGTAQITSKMENGRILAKIDETVEVK